MDGCTYAPPYEGLHTTSRPPTLAVAGQPIKCGPQPSVVNVRRLRGQGKLEQMKAHSRTRDLKSTPGLRIAWVAYAPAPDAQDRLRRVFTILLRHAASEDLPVGGGDYPQTDCEEAKD